jgi:DNA methylase
LPKATARNVETPVPGLTAGASQAEACATILPDPARTHYRVQHEPCWYVRKKGAPWFGKAGESSTVWTSPLLELMRALVVNHLRRGEVVYDPFLGSGTTLAAAELTKRVCYGMDLDPRYVDVAVQRWQTLTGKQATHDADGRSFEEVARERGECADACEEAEGDE